MTHEIEQLIEETVLLFHRLRQFSDEIHNDGKMTAGKRGVLKSLDEHGPQSVPKLARARPVSRQHIQKLVNPLLEEGLVIMVNNPLHKTSKLVRLTPSGTKRIKEINREETVIFDALRQQIDPGCVHTTIDTLSKLRRLLEAGSDILLNPSNHRESNHESSKEE